MKQTNIRKAITEALILSISDDDMQQFTGEARDMLETYAPVADILRMRPETWEGPSRFLHPCYTGMAASARDYFIRELDIWQCQEDYRDDDWRMDFAQSIALTAARELVDWAAVAHVFIAAAINNVKNDERDAA